MTKWNVETAEWYAETYGDYPTNRLGVETLTLQPDSTIVDVGCGTGSALRHASKQIIHGRLIGVDPVPRMVEIAREETAAHAAAERIVFHEGAAESLPIETASADFVLAFDSFDHWHDPIRGLKEVCRILVPNGRFVVVKDGDLPGESEARNAFLETLKCSGFSVVEEENIEAEDVQFSRWICSVAELLT